MNAPVPSRAVRLAWNAGWNMAGQTGLAALGFWLIPFIIRKLGPEGYALYSLLGILSGYLMLLALGAGTATIKYVSEHAAAGRQGALRTILGASFWLHGLGVALGAAAVFAFRHELSGQFFKVEPSSLEAAAWVVACSAGGAVFFALGQYGQSILQGLQRYDLSNAFSLLQSGVFLGGVAILLWLGHGIHAIGTLFIVVSALVCFAVLTTAARLAPVPPSWRFWREARSQTVRDFLTFSVSGVIGQVAWSVAFQWDKMFIGHMLPLSQLTYYLIPSAILQKFWLIPWTIITAAFPMLSELHGAGDQAGVKRFYRKCSQLVLWIVVPGFVMLMVLAPQFLTLWLGEEFSHYGTWPLRLLTMGYFIYFMGSMPGVAAGGLGRMRYAVWANIALAACCLLFWRFFIPRLGIVGAALGFLIAFAAAFLPFLFFVNRDFFRMSWLEYLKDVCLRPFLAGAVLLAIVWAAHFRIHTWASFVLVGGLSAAVYFSLSLLLLDHDSHESLKDVLSAFRKGLALKLAWIN